MSVKKTLLLGLLPAAIIGCDSTGTVEDEGFPDQEKVCNDKFDQSRENQRLASAASFPQPVVTTMEVNDIEVWRADTPGAPAPQLEPGDIVTLNGTGFGAGTDIDFSKIMIGNTRILETDLVMFTQKMDITEQVHFEIPEVYDTWPKDIQGWSDNEIRFRVPEHTSRGPLVVQIQKRTGYNESFTKPGQAHNVIDALTYRVQDPNFDHNCDVVSVLTEESKATTPIDVDISNPGFEALRDLGEKVFWSYDYNIGLAHQFRNLDWAAILNYETTDPYTGAVADPEEQFGAFLNTSAEVPAASIEDVYFDPYPQPSPIPGFLTLPQAKKGNTRTTGWVGYRYAEAIDPFAGAGEWIGFNCASCHGARIEYEDGPGNFVSRIIPGLPNPQWSMRWALLGDFDGVKDGLEEAPEWASGGRERVDKTPLVYSMPGGTAEATMIRAVGEGSLTDNDYEFSPVAIPNVTNYMTIRRSLSHTESYVGFEGSYIHAEEPDGATGAMNKQSLEALTAYMTTLDVYDDDMVNVGMYRWLQDNGKLGAQTGDAGTTEGEFVAAGWSSYPGVVAAVNTGKTTYDAKCGTCHTDQLGTHTNEQMLPLDEVGRFFVPTDFQKPRQSVRVTFLNDVYFTSHRGLLTDGHVRNLDDLVHPDRCTVGSDLYNQYYTLHTPVNPALGGADFPEPFPAYNRRGDVFRVPKESGTDDQSVWRNRFVERHRYFVEVPWDPDYYYWDYQKMIAEYGEAEGGFKHASFDGLPATPHPWCADAEADVDDLVQYVLTL